MEQSYCEKCGKTMNVNQFYTYKNGNKTELCKKCLTMHIDNFNPDTYLWLLEKMDVPYVEGEWVSLRDRAYAKDPASMNGMSVFGKYLSKMKLKQWKDYNWADTERLRTINEERQKAIIKERTDYDAEIKAKYEAGEIGEAEYRTLTSTPLQHDNPVVTPVVFDNPYNENNFIPESELVDPSKELTDEDRIVLAMKWGRLYKPTEWVELEKMYTEMMNSFDIQDADTENTLILICKTNLKMNQAIDVGDLDGFQKLSRVSESLRKSAKFTAAQNKEQKEEFVDCVGELVSLCERDGFIPRFATDIPQDKVDATLRDMNNYLNKLVTQDLGFGRQIEDALKKIQIQKELNDAEEEMLETDDVIELMDQDHEDFYNAIAEQQEQDAKAEEEERGGGE